MHYNVAKQIINSYPDIPMLPLEDAFIGLAAGYSGKVRMMDIYHFMQIEYGIMERSCAFVTSYWIHHKVYPGELLDAWNLCVCVLI